MITVTAPMNGWENIPWRKIERSVFKLQKRIYQASETEVRMKSARSARSRMTGNCHVRFW
jgi:N-terminal domain of reverse transcriptase